jgi:hypothetical protein
VVRYAFVFAGDDRGIYGEYPPECTDLSLKQSSYFVGASMSAYCPQYIGHTDNSLNWLKPYSPVPQW